MARQSAFRVGIVECRPAFQRAGDAARDRMQVLYSGSPIGQLIKDRRGWRIWPVALQGRDLHRDSRFKTARSAAREMSDTYRMT